MSDYMIGLLDIMRKRYLRIICWILVYCTVFQIFYNLLKYDTAVPGGSYRDLIVSWLMNFIPIVLIIVLSIAVIFCISRKIIKSDIMSLKIIVDILLATVVFFGVCWLFILVGSCFDPDIMLDWVGAGLNSILIFLIVEVVYYIIALKESMLKAQEEQKKAMQYSYDVLKAQVNPHFLFNSLNILYSLIAIDTDKSRKFTLQLSSMYRYLLLWQNKDIVPLNEEIEFLKSYVEVLEMRHMGQLLVSISGEENVGNRMIVPHTLQLLLENVTKHNVISARKPMNVSVLFGSEVITVSNPIRLKETDNSTGLGIKYISEIYARKGKSVHIIRENNVFVAIVPYL